MKKLLLLLFLIPNLVMAELTIYRCDPDGKTDGDPNVIKSINKMAQNAKECNSSCKKTNWTIKTKINERANKILVEEYDNGIYKDSKMYESSEPMISSYNNKPMSEGDEVQIFDKKNWTFRSGKDLLANTGQRVVRMKDGKFSSTYEYAFDLADLIPGYYPYQACGK